MELTDRVVQQMREYFRDCIAGWLITSSWDNGAPNKKILVDVTNAYIESSAEHDFEQYLQDSNAVVRLVKNLISPFSAISEEDVIDLRDALGRNLGHYQEFLVSLDVDMRI